MLPQAQKLVLSIVEGTLRVRDRVRLNGRDVACNVSTTPLPSSVGGGTVAYARARYFERTSGIARAKQPLLQRRRAGTE